MIDKLKEILAQYTDIPTETITAETVILRDLGLNSYSVMEIVTEIEDSFNIEIPDAVLPEIKTVGELVSFLEKATA